MSVYRLRAWYEWLRRVAARKRALVGGPTVTPAFVIAATAATGNGASATVTKHASMVDGLLLFAPIGVQAAVTVTPPADWTLAADIGSTIYNTDDELRVYWKIASGEGASWQWGFSATVNYNAQVLAYSGIAASPYISGTEVAPGNVTTVTLPGITTVTVNALLIGVYTNAGGRTWTPPADMTERIDTSSNPTQMVCDRVQAAAGASGTKIGTVSSSAVSAGQLLAFKAAGT